MILSYVSLTLAAVAALGVILLLLRRNQDLSGQLERLERTLRDEAAQGRDEGATQARMAREEVNGLIRAFQDGALASAERNHTDLRLLVEQKLAEFRSDQATQGRALREEVTGSLKSQGETLTTTLRERLDAVARTLAEQTGAVAEHLERLRGENTAKLEQMRQTIDEKLQGTLENQATQGRALREEVTGSLKSQGETLTTTLRERLDAVARTLAEQTRAVAEHLEKLRGENTAKLEQMRQTVDEKLQGTLEKRLGESFKLVSDRLEQVHKGLGEMQNLASGVGDLKRVLTNVKARGTWGEVQLGTLLEQFFRPDQFLREANCRKGSLERVDYAIRLPGRDGAESEVLLPIDSKFPNEDYERLQMAVERADAEAVEAAAKALETRVRLFARDIRDKYVNPPFTTDFAIMFLPTEGLYAEVLRRPGLQDQIQRDFKVVAAGPTTLGAILNAIQMGFRTLAIEKRSSEVWEILGAVKTEFGKYGDILEKVQNKLQEASKTIDAVAVRKRAIDRRLRSVEAIPEAGAQALLAVGGVVVDDGGEDEGA